MYATLVQDCWKAVRGGMVGVGCWWGGGLIGAGGIGGWSPYLEAFQDACLSSTAMSCMFIGTPPDPWPYITSYHPGTPPDQHPWPRCPLDCVHFQTGSPTLPLFQRPTHTPEFSMQTPSNHLSVTTRAIHKTLPLPSRHTDGIQGPSTPPNRHSVTTTTTPKGVFGSNSTIMS